MKIGFKSDGVRNLQEMLKTLGYYSFTVDGDFGLRTDIAVKKFQLDNKLKMNGIVDNTTLQKIQEKIDSLSDKKSIDNTVKESNYYFSLEQLKLIIDYEVGGGESYYNRFLIKPTLPPAASGCTIMIGVDLRFTPKSDFDKMMERALKDNILSQSDYYKLIKLLGKKPTSSEMKTVEHIRIPYNYALYCFMEFTVPKFWKLVLTTFPGTDQLKWQAQVALLSLVFNRGGSLNGDSRRHMRTIRDLVPKKDYKGIAQQLRDMKSLWVNIEGLRKRRDAEADLVLS